MSRETREILEDALVHLHLVERYARGDLEDQLVIDAVCMRLSASIEVLSTLAPELRVRLFRKDWSRMWGLRNRIAHGYLLVNPAIIRETVNHDVAVITERIQAELR